MVSRWEPAALVMGTMAAAGLVYADVQHPIRTLASLLFVATVPGLAALRLLRLQDPTMKLLLVVPLSLALAAIVSAILVYATLPSWDLAMWILISIVIGALTLDLARPTLPSPTTVSPVTGKLADHDRQDRLIDAFLGGASLKEAASAAAVNPATVRKASERSPALRRAIVVASRGAVDPISRATRDRRGGRHTDGSGGSPHA